MLQNGLSHPRSGDSGAGSTLNILHINVLKMRNSLFLRLGRSEHHPPVLGHGFPGISLGHHRIAVAGIPVAGCFKSSTHIAHLDIPEIDILHRSAPGQGRFEPEANTGTNGLNVVCQYIPDPSGSFASAGEQASPGTGDTIAYDDVFARAVHPQAVPVPASLETEIIIVAINIAVLHQNLR